MHNYNATGSMHNYEPGEEDILLLKFVLTVESIIISREHHCL